MRRLSCARVALLLFVGPALSGVGCGADPVTYAPELAGPAPFDIPPPDEEPPSIVAGSGDAALRPDEVLGPPYPVILVHGFSGWSDIGPLEYFFDVKDDLAALGVDVTTPALPPYAASAARARVLGHTVDEVLARTKKAKVHLIGHSQGGVDIRTLVVTLGYAPHVASVTTISSPWRGTPIADLASRAPGGLLNGAGRFLAWLVGVLDGPPPALDDAVDDDTWTPALGAVIENLRPETMAAFVEANPWPADLPVFSIAGVSNLRSLDNDDCQDGLWEAVERVDDIDPLFAATGTYLSFTGGGTLVSPTPNDGVITARSARDGTFLGCIPADHTDEIGQLYDTSPGFLSRFDHKELYRRLIRHLRDLERAVP